MSKALFSIFLYSNKNPIGFLLLRMALYIVPIKKGQRISLAPARKLSGFGNPCAVRMENNKGSEFRQVLHFVESGRLIGGVEFVGDGSATGLCDADCEPIAIPSGAFYHGASGSSGAVLP